MAEVIAALSDSIHIRDAEITALVEAGAVVRFCKHYAKVNGVYQIEDSIQISEHEWGEVEIAFSDIDVILRLAGQLAEICSLAWPYKVKTLGIFQNVEWKEALENDTGYVYYPDTKEYFMTVNKYSIRYH